MSMEELQIGAGTPKELTDPVKPWPAPEVAIPAAAQTEINRMHADLVAKAKSFEAARVAFGEFIRTAKKTLNVPADQNWDIKPDASAFVRVA